jgi:serine/threonine protein kinase
VKLTDFGIARAVADASLTQTGLVTGSPAYLAPEVAAGSKATNASDTWSLGATLFHALAGHPPYEVTENPLGTLYKIINEDPPRLPGAGWLAPVLESTMATDPEDRWSMERVRDVLAMGPTATPQTTQYMAPPSSYGVDDAERTQAMPPTAAPLQEDPPDHEDPTFVPDAPAPEPGSRRRRVSPGLLALLAAVVVLALVVLLGWALLSGDSNQPEADKKGSGSGSGSETPSQSPSPTKKKTEKKQEKPARAEMTAFVEDYLATVTSNPAQSWKMLTPQFQAESGGFSSYSGFWSTIESARPSAIRANPRDMTVSYSVTYQKAGGGTESDDVTLQLVEKNGEYLIAGEV